MNNTEKQRTPEQIRQQHEHAAEQTNQTSVENERYKFATLVGGMELRVEMLDGSSETVRVRQVPVKLYPEMAKALTDELKMAELLCDKPAAWVENLTPESHEQIITEGERINARYFFSWIERSKKNAQRAPKPDMGEIVQIIEVLQRANPAMLEGVMQKALSESGMSAPKQPSPAVSPAK
jgi:hypothetical protein